MEQVERENVPNLLFFPDCTIITFTNRKQDHIRLDNFVANHKIARSVTQSTRRCLFDPLNFRNVDGINRKWI